VTTCFGLHFLAIIRSYVIFKETIQYVILSLVINLTYCIFSMNKTYDLMMD